MISPTYDELHDRVAEDAKLLELMDLLRECEAFLRQAHFPHFKDILCAEELVKRIEEVLK